MAYNRIASVGELSILNGTQDDKTVLQTLDNIICFESEITGVTRNAQTAFAQLPNVIDYPDKLILFPCIYREGTTHTNGIFFITTSGYIACITALNNATVYLNGITVNLNKNFYNSTIGNNNMMHMTRPMNYD